MVKRFVLVMVGLKLDSSRKNCAGIWDLSS